MGTAGGLQQRLRLCACVARETLIDKGFDAQELDPLQLLTYVDRRMPIASLEKRRHSAKNSFSAISVKLRKRDLEICSDVLR